MDQQEADEHALKQKREELSQLVHQLGSLASEKQSADTMLAERLLALAQLDKQLTFLDKELGEARRQEAASGQFALLSSVLASLQDSLREAFLERVNTNLAAIWPVLYPYGDFSTIRLDAEEGDYILRLREANRWVSAEMVSGGERSAAALALRIAFTHTFLPHLRWLFLDEPTHNLDDRSVRQLAGALQDRIPYFVDQVFLITHDDRLAEGAHTIRLTRDKAQDMPTMVQEA